MELLKMAMLSRALWAPEIISWRAATKDLSTRVDPSPCAGFSTPCLWHSSATGTLVLAGERIPTALVAALSVHKSISCTFVGSNHFSQAVVASCTSTIECLGPLSSSTLLLNLVLVCSCSHPVVALPLT